MKKGDLRKQEILNTAETLFCRNGYEQTSIQDILDLLNSSKGSFYHHFVSKEALLEGICKRRAEQIYNHISDTISKDDAISNQLDSWLSGMIPVPNEKLSFLMMILPVFLLPEGRMIRDAYCDSLKKLFLPPVANVLLLGQKRGELICNDPDITAELILHSVNSLWIKICTIIISAEENQTDTDLSYLLRITECYRRTIERMLSVTYGSIKLIDIPEIGKLSDQIHNHWKK